LLKSLLNIDVNEEKFYVFVDDFSSDGTVDFLIGNLPENNYKIITKLTNFGPGHSFELGLNWILANSNLENDTIVTMEGDNTSDLSILKQMLGASKLGFDLVLASVYAQGGGFSETSIVRKLISSVANLVFRFAFNIRILTISSFYRVYKPLFLRRIKEEYGQIISEVGFISMLEILIKHIKLNATIIEVPMKLNSANRKGKSKMKIFKTALSYLRFLWNFNKNG
jgi:glycosyltransferase involved in cell wall biosynthesis